MKITVATCQFAVGSDIARTCGKIIFLLEKAARGGAHIAHFGECSLGGYAGVDFPDFCDYNWELDDRCKARISEACRDLGLWAAFGGNHRLGGSLLPHNSVFIVDSRGRLVDRYDKIIHVLSPSEAGKKKTGDHAHYSSGTRSVVFKVKGITLGVLICSDFRKPQLYHHYKSLGAQVMLHSYHNGGQRKQHLDKHKNVWGQIVPATMQAYASNNDVWISASNTSRRWSCWPAFFVTPDGIITGKLPLHRTGVLFSRIDTSEHFYRASHYVYKEIEELYSNPYVKGNRRSECRTNF